MKIPIIEAEQLKLEPLSPRHSQGMFDLWSCPSVCEYSGVVNDYKGNVINTPVNSLNDSDLIIYFWMQAVKEGWGFRWALILKDKFVGTIGFNSCKDAYEIAYHLIPRFSGQGIMTQASNQAISWAVNQGANEVIAYIEPQNKLSIALALRLEMQAQDEFSDGAQKYSLKL